MRDLLTPKFLTAHVAKEAVNLVMRSLSDGPTRKKLRRHAGHIVVMVPSMVGVARDAHFDWPYYPGQPVLIYEKSIGDKAEWTGEYDKIARSKAMQLWRDQNSDGNTDSMPHLLFEGDTPYWGGVKRHGIVVAFSGVQSYFDQMIAGMVADAIKALARHEWEMSDDKKKKESFLT